jgi:two-component system, OmpR family, response regulator
MMRAEADGSLKTADPWLQPAVRSEGQKQTNPGPKGRQKTMRILLIEDDMVLGAAVRDQIVADGHSVDWVQRLDAAGDAMGAASFDLVLLDLMLPDGRGIPFLRRLRARGDVTPVIILTALDQISDRIEGLNAGADDYLVKPFDLAELSARIGSVARRYAGNPNPIVTHGSLEIDLAARGIHRDGRPVSLTAREWALLEAFLSRPGQLLSKAQLEDKLYAFGVEIESNTIEVHISRLRKKLGADVIETERGLGYRLGRA